MALTAELADQALTTFIHEESHASRSGQQRAGDTHRSARTIVLIVGLPKSRGLHARIFTVTKLEKWAAEWIPESELEGFQGIVHGGIPQGPG